MDDKQLTALIQRVLIRLREEIADASDLPKAYFILPQGWQNENSKWCIEALKALKGTYRLIAVFPDEGNDNDDRAALYDTGMTVALRRSEVVFPDENFFTIFPIASQNLVIKAALCLQDDFETKWIARCIADGQPIYMQRESPFFTGKEPAAYRKKIESYYQQAREFGIQFNTFPPRCCSSQGTAESGPSQKKKIITVKDLDKLSESKELRLRPGDLITALAAERAEECGINILYQ